MSKSEDPCPITSANEVSERLQSDQLRIVDCRFDLADPAAGRREYLAGHVPGAVYADLDRDLSSPVTAESGRHPLPDVAAATETFRRLGVSSSSSVVVYDTSGGAIAARAWWLLRWLGHDDVALLEGGLDAWQQQDLPLASGDQAVSPGNFEARPRNELVLSTEELVAEPVSIMRSRLVDARDAARFRGDVEPIDAVAGHVPGSVNLPFSDCLDDSGRWRQAGELKALLETVLGNDSDAPWAVMCGSGVTACHLAISAQLAGYREPQLYAGSWSEWIRDPSRPVATGPTVIRKIPT